MAEKRTTEPMDWKEGRRLQAWKLRQQGWSQTRIAEALGVTQGAVSQWIKRGDAGGIEALRRRKAAGPRPLLTDEQLRQLPDLLARGAEAWGFRGAVWTRERVAAVIEATFGVRYHISHISRILRAIGWTRQKPAKRARQRKAEKVTAWREDVGPTLKKRR